MSVSINFITGFMVGLEFFAEDELVNGGLIIDLGIVRIIFAQVL